MAYISVSRDYVREVIIYNTLPPSLPPPLLPPLTAHPAAPPPPLLYLCCCLVRLYNRSQRRGDDDGDGDDDPWGFDDVVDDAENKYMTGTTMWDDNNVGDYTDNESDGGCGGDGNVRNSLMLYSRSFECLSSTLLCKTQCEAASLGFFLKDLLENVK